jgi:16S rRNA (guanine966-N2)-methyltransferase
LLCLGPKISKSVRPIKKSASLQGGEPPKRVRIIGGLWRSRLLTVIDLPGLRPSTDRIRETVFNWLGQDLTGLRCLDLFAGTGALGFEAASRDAASVTLLEKDKKAYSNLLKNFSLLQSSPASGSVDILHEDSLAFLKRQSDSSSNLIFIDPPFQDKHLLEQSVVEAGRVCNDGIGGGIYIEFPSNQPLEQLLSLLPGWNCEKYLEAGQVKACLLRSRSD